MNKAEIENVAYEIESWLQDAAYDMASGLVGNSFFTPGEIKWETAIKEAKDEGVRDIVGWLADEIYDDVDTICNLCGDRLHDESKGNTEDYVAIAEEIKVGCITSHGEAMDRLIAERKKFE